MEPKKYRIPTSRSTGIGSSYGSQIDCNNYDDFVEKLKINRITQFSLKYHTPYDDVPSFAESGLTPETVTQKNFNWLTEKSPGSPRFLEIDCISKYPYVPGTVLHNLLMPYTDGQLKKYFNPASASKHVQYFTNSVGKYKNYENNKEEFHRDGFKEFRQAEKDERFFTTRALVGLFEDPNKKSLLKTLLIKAFGDDPPFKNIITMPGMVIRSSWDDLLSQDLELQLEKDISAPKLYLEHLSKSLHKRHFVPYVIEKGKPEKSSCADPESATQKTEKTYRPDLEGSTQIDAVIESKGKIKIFIEAKYLSDISCDVSYDMTRNQIARTIDVMLEEKTDKSLFLLLTPKYFKDHPESRLYGYKMRDYLSNHLTLMADLHHRHDIEPYEWKSITKRIGWITWEDIHDLGIHNLPSMRNYQDR